MRKTYVAIAVAALMTLPAVGWGQTLDDDIDDRPIATQDQDRVRDPLSDHDQLRDRDRLQTQDPADCPCLNEDGTRSEDCLMNEAREHRGDGTYRQYGDGQGPQNGFNPQYQNAPGYGDGPNAQGLSPGTGFQNGSNGR